MKTRFFFLILTLSLFVSLHAAGQVVFYADFEPGSKEAKPNANVNNVKSYKPENAGTVWAAGDFNGGKIGGKKSMTQTAEGCGISGNTELPGVDNFTDGIIQVVFSFGDDDSFGVQFRRKGDDKGYLVVFGYNETSSVLFMSLEDGCCPSGQCLSECGCENGGKEIAGVPHGLGAGLDQTNAVPYLGRVEVQGNDVKIWYMKLELKSKTCSHPPRTSETPYLNPMKPLPRVLAPSGSGTKVGGWDGLTAFSLRVPTASMLRPKAKSLPLGARLNLRINGIL